MLWMSKKEMQADLLSKVILLPKPSCRKPSYGSISKTSTCNSRPSRLYELPVHRALCFLVYYFHWVLTTVIQMLLFYASQRVNWGLAGSNWLPQDCQQQGRVPAGSLDLFPINDTVSALGPDAREREVTCIYPSSPVTQRGEKQLCTQKTLQSWTQGTSKIRLERKLMAKRFDVSVLIFVFQDKV